MLAQGQWRGFWQAPDTPPPYPEAWGCEKCGLGEAGARLYSHGRAKREGNSVFKWLRRRREATRRVVEDADRLAKKSGQVEPPADPDPIEEQGDEFGDNASLVDAIALCRQGLDLSPRERVPLQWATTQMKLGNALAEHCERSGRRLSRGAEGIDA